MASKRKSKKPAPVQAKIDRTDLYMAKSLTMDFINKHKDIQPIGMSFVRVVVAGARSGQIKAAELMEVLEKVSLDDETIEQIYSMISTLHIKLTDDSGNDVDIGSEDNEDGEAKKERESLVEQEIAAAGLTLFLQQIGEIPLLTKEEEREYFTKYIDGKKAKEIQAEREKEGRPLDKSVPEDKEILRKISAGKRAEDTLINSNLRLVVSVAKKFVGRGQPLDDLIQNGNLGLMRAVQKFSLDKNTKFSTYAVLWIRQSINRHLTTDSRVVRMPTNVIESIGRVKKEKEQLEDELNRDATPKEIAERCGMSEEKIKQVLKAMQSTISLDRPTGEDGDTSILDYIQDSSPSPDDVATLSIRREFISDILDSLAPREEKIIRIRFGLEDGQYHTLEEIGMEFGLTRERVRQLEANALNELRNKHKDDMNAWR